MKEYVFSFSNEMESNGNKYNIPEETAYGPYDSEKEAILEAIRMCEYYNLNFTHLFIGKAGYFVPRIDADLVLGDLAQRAVDNEAYYLGAAVKYLYRYPAKGTAIKDLRKAKQYIEMLIELKEEQNHGTR